MLSGISIRSITLARVIRSTSRCRWVFSATPSSTRGLQMKCLTYYAICIVILSIAGCQVGCGSDEEEIQTALTQQQLSDIETENKQYLYENADWDVRVEQWEKARKRYFKLRKSYPNAAVNAYIEYRNWFHYGHPSAEEVARLSAGMDMAGQGNLPNIIKLAELELQIAKDNKKRKDHIAELEENLLFWTELLADLKEHGDDPNEFIIEYEIQEEIEWE